MPGDFWRIVVFDRKLGLRCLLKVKRSCPRERFLGSAVTESSLIPLQSCSVGLAWPIGKTKVDAGGGGLDVVADSAWSAASFSARNLLKYRSEANSVMCRGSMMPDVAVRRELSSIPMIEIKPHVSLSGG
jgi:hypothetical protein